MKQLSLSLVAIFLTLNAVASVPDFLKPGPCPNVNKAALWEQQQRNHWQMDGNWYQHSRTPNPFDPFAKCMLWRLEYLGGAFRTESTGLDANGAAKKTLGSLFYDLPGKQLTVTHEGAPPGSLVVLDTDYKNYACFYSCKDTQGKYYADFGFIFSRTPNMDPDHVRICHKAFKKIGVDTTTFVETPQGPGCSYENKQDEVA
ncbi:crustacyanin-C1 subunit-like [Macrobrachium rosenbergii]|uniref:crustacyanin-C1 subunit-like n=1 Tax=Macrobrachium rosenbergii TaxID=79674 RepID=UPI0034D6791A